MPLNQPITVERTTAHFIAQSSVKDGKWAVVRSTVIGWFSGILPGVGATLAAFLSYNEAVRWSKHPERFGTGEAEGVVAPETANNAATGAAMIPLLALSLPGGALTAMMIGVFNLHDMEVGPLIMIEAPELVWILFASMFWASLAILVLGMVESKGIVHLLRIPFTMLAPGILLFSTIGAYALRGNIFDVYTMFIAGIAGYFLRRSDYSVPAIVMGVILGQIGENSLSQALTILDYNFWGFFTEPVSAVFCGVGILTIVWGIARRARQYFGS